MLQFDDSLPLVIILLLPWFDKGYPSLDGQTQLSVTNSQRNASQIVLHIYFTL